MKKFLFVFFVFMISAGYACSSCNVEFSEEEKLSFTIATVLLIAIPFVAGYFFLKWIKKHYQ